MQKLVSDLIDLEAIILSGGVSKAGENGCANAAGTHSCAGQSTVDFDGGEWKLVNEGSCTQMGGSLEPTEGVNEEAKSKAG